MATNIIDSVATSWGWTGLKPTQLIAANSFGNLLIEDEDGQYWRICPEELSYERVADTKAAFDALLVSDDFQLDWEMTRLVQIAHKEWGAPPDGGCCCLKLPSPLGGAYEEENIGIMWLRDLIAFSGDLALQIKDLPDGAQIHLDITD